MRFIFYLCFFFNTGLYAQCIAVTQVSGLTPPPGIEIFPTVTVGNITDEQILRHNDLATHAIEITPLSTGDFMKLEVWIVDDLNIRLQRIINAYVTDEYNFTVLAEDGSVSAVAILTAYDGLGGFPLPGIGFNKQDFSRPLGYDYGGGVWNGSQWISNAKRLEIVVGTSSDYIDRFVDLYHTIAGVDASQETYQVESYETAGSVFPTGIPNDDFFPTDIVGLPNQAGPFSLSVNGGQFSNGQAAILYATQIQNVNQTLSSTVEFTNEMTTQFNRPNTTELRATFISFPTSGGASLAARMARVFMGRLFSNFTDFTPRFGFVVKDAGAVDRTSGIVILNDGVVNPLLKSNDIGSQFILQDVNIPHVMTIGDRYLGEVRLLDIGATLLYEQIYQYELNYAW